MTADSVTRGLCALLGHPVAGNPTEEMFERAFTRAGLDWTYVSLDVSPGDLSDAVRGLRAMGFRGAHVTIPHKVSVIDDLDRLTEQAARIGAVNCIVLERGALVGHNTDGRGFLESVRGVADPAGAEVVILGAGGAARAVAFELAIAGATALTIVNRGPERGTRLAADLRTRGGVDAVYVPWRSDYVVPSRATLLVNCTSVGLDAPGDLVPVDLESLRRGLVVADVVMNPPVTRLLAEADARGCVTLDGLGMLVEQGAIAFRLWTGVEPDRQVMRDALATFFSRGRTAVAEDAADASRLGGEEK